jgi:hypothetical protein
VPHSPACTARQQGVEVIEVGTGRGCERNARPAQLTNSARSTDTNAPPRPVVLLRVVPVGQLASPGRQRRQQQPRVRWGGPPAALPGKRGASICMRPILTEIYLCRAYSCHEILRQKLRVETPWGSVGRWATWLSCSRPAIEAVWTDPCGRAMFSSWSDLLLTF